MKKITTFLMFEGQAEAAINFYVSLFEKSEIVSVTQVDGGNGGPATPLIVFSLNGQEFMAFDSPVKHGFTFTPAISLYVHCESEAEIDSVFGTLAEGGQVFMPLGSYGFSKRFGWVQDKFGVSWQLTLENGG